MYQCFISFLRPVFQLGLCYLLLYHVGHFRPPDFQVHHPWGLKRFFNGSPSSSDSLGVCSNPIFCHIYFKLVVNFANLSNSYSTSTNPNSSRLSLVIGSCLHFTTFLYDLYYPYRNYSSPFCLFVQ